MSRGARKITGFIWAMVLAVVSFFIIYLFFPDFSNRYLGVSLRNAKKVADAVKDTGDMIGDSIIDANPDALTSADEVSLFLEKSADELSSKGSEIIKLVSDYMSNK